MISARILVVLDDGPKRSALARQLECLGAEVFMSGTGSGGLLLLGRLQPDVLVLDPTAGRGRSEDWRRGVERYRSNRSLSLWVQGSSEFTRASMAAEADLGSGPVGEHVQLLDQIENEFGSGDFRHRAA